MNSPEEPATTRRIIETLAEAASERRHRAALPQRVRAARGHDPLGAVDRRAREPGDAGAVQALSGRARAGDGDDRGARAADRLDRLLPPEVEGADRHGADARRRARRRGAGRHGEADRAARRRPQDGERRPRPRARRARAARRSPRAARVEPHRHRRGDDPEKVEAQLCAALPPEMWTLASDVQILHGRRICRPKPLCDSARSARTATTTAASGRRGRPKARQGRNGRAKADAKEAAFEPALAEPTRMTRAAVRTPRR